MKKYICSCENMCMHVYICSILCWSVYVYNVYMIINNIYVYKWSWISWRLEEEKPFTEQPPWVCSDRGHYVHCGKQSGDSQWHLLVSSTFYRVEFANVWKSKTRKWWIQLWISGYLGLVDLRKCILIPPNPSGSVCSPVLGTPDIAVKVGSRLAE